MPDEASFEVEFGANLAQVLKLIRTEQAKLDAIAAITRALECDELVHRVADSLPLADVARGNELVETAGVRGSALLTI